MSSSLGVLIVTPVVLVWILKRIELLTVLVFLVAEEQVGRLQRKVAVILMAFSEVVVDLLMSACPKSLQTALPASNYMPRIQSLAALFHDPWPSSP
jgi:hypothetical protein